MINILNKKTHQHNKKIKCYIFQNFQAIKFIYLKYILIEEKQEQLHSFSTAKCTFLQFHKYWGWKNKIFVRALGKQLFVEDVSTFWWCYLSGLFTFGENIYILNIKWPSRWEQSLNIYFV